MNPGRGVDRHLEGQRAEADGQGASAGTHDADLPLHGSGVSLIIGSAVCWTLPWLAITYVIAEIVVLVLATVLDPKGDATSPVAGLLLILLIITAANARRGVCWCVESLLAWGVVGSLRSRVGG